MTNIGRHIAELEHIWRARCGKCGDTQVVTKDLKSEAEWVLTDMLSWKKTKAGWICRNCKDGHNAPSEWNPANLNEAL